MLVARDRRSFEAHRLTQEIHASPLERGKQFYLHHYVIGLPDEARSGQELQGVNWLHANLTQDIMAAIGLAGLSNLTGDKETGTLAKHHYGLALQSIALTVRNMATADLDLLLRSVIMMAMYEVSCHSTTLRRAIFLCGSPLTTTITTRSLEVGTRQAALREPTSWEGLPS